MKNIDKVREIAPELVEEYSQMSKDELLEACCGEILDLWDMQERVDTFMSLCTNMSKTNYTPEIIEKLVKEKREEDIQEFCYLSVDEIDGSIEEEDIRAKAEQYKVKYNL